MEAGKFFLYNGEMIASGRAVITADNRSFRFGDGFFETMKLINGNIVLSNYHFQRLFSSLSLLKFITPDNFTIEYFTEAIKKIAVRNDHSKLARIRLTIFRGDGGLYDTDNNLPNYIIQTWKTDEAALSFNKEGLTTGIYTDARKTSDAFSHIKTNNYLPYLMGAQWAKENKLDDAIILNNYNRIADATIANVFLVKNNIVKTPSLAEGCVAGVMRSYLLHAFQTENISCNETEININELADADEVFITNTAIGIKWVKQCNRHLYTNGLSEYLFNKLILPLWKIR
jgi:branched-chain amino acid aminotransferase